MHVLLQTLLPDGVRTVITGGTVSMNVSTPVPSAEIYNHASLNIVKQDTLPILQRFAGMILYPLGELSLSKVATSLRVPGVTMAMLSVLHLSCRSEIAVPNIN
jgi:hypothetical protein